MTPTTQSVAIACAVPRETATYEHWFTRVLATVNAAPFPHVLIIGDLILQTQTPADLAGDYDWANSSLPGISPNEYCTLAGAAEVAARLRAIHVGVSLLGLIGHDIAGQRLRAALSEHGLEDRYLIEDDAIATIHVACSDEYQFASSGIFLACHYSQRGLHRLIQAIPAAYEHCGAVVVEDHGLGLITEGLLAQLEALRATCAVPSLIGRRVIPKGVPIFVA